MIDQGSGGPECKLHRAVLPISTDCTVQLYHMRVNCGGSSIMWVDIPLAACSCGHIWRESCCPFILSSDCKSVLSI